MGIFLSELLFDSAFAIVMFMSNFWMLYIDF
ncbi:hypothetical protein Goshw_018738 [Gossypium schwendimanii]|uniref:Uncharacterized protein n=1 Tax=Gossypium schwendimanii TaxID=34291 RepID=A0A7J9KM79_GOSSC|nr:hypothetical protein [Gossypium schwendimanii]